ncbi:MAG: RNA polymerase sigma factor [Mangrovibacterium sp.]
MLLQKEEKNWFREVFDKEYNFIRNYLYYLSGDIDLSEDLSQDTFTQLWQNRQTVNRESQRQFLFTIARNLFLKHYRHQKIKFNFINSLFSENETETPEFKLELKEYNQQIQGVLSAMPEKTRAIFLMSRIDLMSYTEIAANLGISNKAVEKHVSKALSILRTKIGRKL